MTGATPTDALKVVFTGCARDVGEFLPDVLANLSRLASRFREAAFIFIENDSVDNTRQLLETFGLGRQTDLIRLDGLALEMPNRTERLAHCRNAYVERIKSSPWAEFDLMISVDLDEMSVYPMDLENFSSSIRYLLADDRRAAIFANQLGTYYDMWALRHPKICPGDIWEEVFDHVLAHEVSDEEAFMRTFARRTFSLKPGQRMLKVLSAFGGFGIYRMPFVVNNERRFIGSKEKKVKVGKTSEKIGWQTCEHVSFHAGIAEQGGRLFIDPALINGKTTNLSFPPSVYRSYAFPLSPEQVSAEGGLFRPAQ